MIKLLNRFQFSTSVHLPPSISTKPLQILVPNAMSSTHSIHHHFSNHHPPQTKLSKTSTKHRHRSRIKEPFLSILPHPSSNLKPQHFHPSTHTTTTLKLISHPSTPTSIHQLISQLQHSHQIFSTDTLLSQSLKSHLISSQPSSSTTPPSHHQHSSSSSHPLQVPHPPCSKVYLNYLQSSTNPSEFAQRLHDLINKRLPRSLSHHLADLHSREPSLQPWVSTDSFNQLIRFYYQSHRYDQVRRLLDEMRDRGLEFNLETHQLILCSYQALHKTRAVDLTLQHIQHLGHQLTSQAWVSLFAIRPRQASRLRHLDHMDGTPDDPPSGLPLDRFLNGWRWGSRALNQDGRAMVTMAKRLINAGHWSHAHHLLHTALHLDPSPKLSSYWATQFLHTLISGLYHAKREFSKSAKARGLTPTDISHARRQQLDSLHHLPNSNSKQALPTLPPISCPFQLVEAFIDQHLPHRISTNPSILLNCLRIESGLAPSQIASLLDRWTDRYGLKRESLGSRVAVRLGHVSASWLTKAEIGLARQEYMRMIKLWPELEAMVLRGPIDGQPIRGLHAYYSSQTFQSIRTSLKRLSKLRKKLLGDEAEDPFESFLNRNQKSEDDETKMRWKDGLLIECDRVGGRVRVLYDWNGERRGVRPIRMRVS